MRVIMLLAVLSLSACAKDNNASQNETFSKQAILIHTSVSGSSWELYNLKITKAGDFYFSYNIGGASKNTYYRARQGSYSATGSVINYSYCYSDASCVEKMDDCTIIVDGEKKCELAKHSSMTLSKKDNGYIVSFEGKDLYFSIYGTEAIPLEISTSKMPLVSDVKGEHITNF